MRQLLVELQIDQLVSQPTIILGDNRTANSWVIDEKVTQGNMWILQCYHYVKEMANETYVKVDYVNTKFNLADLFTKGVPKEVLDALEPYLCGKVSLGDLLSKNLEWNTMKKEAQSNGTQEHEKKKEEM